MCNLIFLQGLEKGGFRGSESSVNGSNVCVFSLEMINMSISLSSQIERDLVRKMTIVIG